MNPEYTHQKEGLKYMYTQDYMTLGARSSLMGLTIQMMYEISLKPSKNSTAQMGLDQRIQLSKRDLRRSLLGQY